MERIWPVNLLVSQCFLKWFNKFGIFIILFHDITSLCLFKICNGYSIVAINSIISFPVSLKIKSPQNDDMGKLRVTLYIIHMCKRKVSDAKCGQIFFSIKRGTSGERGHFDLSTTFSYKGHTDGMSKHVVRWPFISSLCLSGSFSATNACTRKQNPPLDMGALKNLV